MLGVPASNAAFRHMPSGEILSGRTPSRTRPQVPAEPPLRVDALQISCSLAGPCTASRAF